MTYGERYRATTSWQASHIAQDLMLANGRDTQVSEQDEAKLRVAEYADAHDLSFHVAAAKLSAERK